LREIYIKRERMRNVHSASVLHACKDAHTLFTSQRERERDKEGGREREIKREGERERERER
jgi:hypothetical protein